ESPGRGAAVPREADRRVRAERVSRRGATAGDRAQDAAGGEDVRRIVSMRGGIAVLTTAFLAAAATAGAQGAAPAPAMSQIEFSIACAPPPTLAADPDKAPRIVGSQDTSPRTVFGGSDLLVLDGGTKAGLQLGQQFFVRRANSFGMYRFQPAHHRGAKTLGWVHVVAVNEATAIAQIDHTCGDLLAGDYLEPLVAPAVPATAESTDTSGEPD